MNPTPPPTPPDPPDPPSRTPWHALANLALMLVLWDVIRDHPILGAITAIVWILDTCLIVREFSKRRQRNQRRVDSP